MGEIRCRVRSIVLVNDGHAHIVDTGFGVVPVPCEEAIQIPVVGIHRVFGHAAFGIEIAEKAREP